MILLHPRPRLSIRTALCVAAVLMVFGAGACSDDRSAGGSTTSTTSAPGPDPGPGATPAPTLAAAVQALLGADQQGDHAGSYRRLTDASRARVGSETRWARLRSELPAITRFDVAPGKTDGTVVATVEHRPGLDAFVGLSPAEERQTWKGARAGSGWLVDAAPRIVAVYPPAADAPELVRKWATAVQSCNEDFARLAQGVDVVFGTSTAAGELCGSDGAVEVGEAAKLESGPTSAELVAQYTDAALQWARVVPVEGPATPFNVIVAPIGDDWRVIGVSD